MSEGENWRCSFVAFIPATKVGVATISVVRNVYRLTPMKAGQIITALNVFIGRQDSVVVGRHGSDWRATRIDNLAFAEIVTIWAPPYFKMSAVASCKSCQYSVGIGN